VPARPTRAVRAAAIALLAVAAACRGGNAADRPAGRPPVPVTVAAVESRDLPEEASAVGSVQPFVSVSVRPLVTGAIVAVPFREGDAVRAGQPIFRIDPRPYQATLAEARANLARARDEANNAGADARRYAELVTKEFVTRQQYDAAVANASALAATVAADEAAVRKAELDLASCTIASPIAGRTGAVLVQVGNVVQANQASPLVMITQTRPIAVAFTLPEQHVLALRSGVGHMRVLAEPPGAGSREGTLVFVNNAVDPSAGTILAKATFPNEDEALWPGLYVNVRIVLGTTRGAIVAPASALVRGQSGSYVYVVRPDQTVEQRPVEVSRTTASDAVVARGLAAGERVVTDGQLALVPGAPVAEKPPAQAAPPVQGRRP
jgi:multidrug efflux system membrane fusion protein